MDNIIFKDIQKSGGCKFFRQKLIPRLVPHKFLWSIDYHIRKSLLFCIPDCSCQLKLLGKTLMLERNVMSIQDTIKEQVTTHNVVLYMKGTPQFPQCGFSSNAVQILKACGVSDFLAVNVLAEPEIRDGIKAYANWPTIPQLYIKGQFIGGSDIMKEMYQSGELQKLLTEA